MKKPIVIVALLVVAAAVVLLFAGGGGGAGGVVFWTTDHEPERERQQKEIAAEFEAKSGQAVKVHPVPEKDLKVLLAQQVAAKTVPHVIRCGIEHVVGYERDGLIDADAATAVVEALGVETFAAGAIAPVRRGSKCLAVPVDGWAQGIWYRKDLFEEKGLAPPADWPSVLAAAQALNVTEGEGRRYGIVLPRHPGSQYPQQIFEHLAMSAGAKLFDDDGNLRHDSPEIRRTVAFWKELARYGPQHDLIEPAQAQLYYLKGQAAMIFYSPYILDDIAGMTKNRENLARVDLAKVTGFVPSLSEKPGGPPAGYGQLVYLAIMKGAPPAAGDWCRYLVSDAYMRVLSMAKGGKVPARPEFLERWRQFEFFKLYDPAIPDQIIKGLGASGRWGFREGRAFTAIADVYGKHVFAEALDEMVSGGLSVDETMSRIAAKMEPIVKGLGE